MTLCQKSLPCKCSRGFWTVAHQNCRLADSRRTGQKHWYLMLSLKWCLSCDTYLHSDSQLPRSNARLLSPLTSFQPAAWELLSRTKGSILGCGQAVKRRCRADLHSSVLGGGTCQGIIRRDSHRIDVLVMGNHCCLGLQLCWTCTCRPLQLRGPHRRCIPHLCTHKHLLCI